MERRKCAWRKKKKKRGKEGRNCVASVSEGGRNERKKWERKERVSLERIRRVR